MITAERQDEILTLLKEKKYMSIAELCQRLHFSESTMRRDLKKLQREGLITCTRGGAVCDTHPNLETPLALRQSTNHDVKRRIAKKAAELVQDNQMILIDASTTAMEIIPFLRNKKHLTIVTCCLSAAISVAERLDCTLICTGGKYHPPSAALVGFSAETAVKNWFADLMFFSVNSIDAQNGLTDQGEEIAQLKIAMLRQAKQTVLLADSSKFGKTSAYKLSPVEISTIITNPDPVFDQECWTPYRQKILFCD